MDESKAWLDLLLLLFKSPELATTELLLLLLLEVAAGLDFPSLG